MSVATFGLTHLAIGVEDPARAFAFYQRVFGMVACVYRKEDFVQAQTPGARDVLVFERTSAPVGATGSIAHFGFRLTRPSDIGAAIAAVREAGGTVLETASSCPGAVCVLSRSRRVYGGDLVRDPYAG
jgi:predicted enzyme related to lactoylglutathione lyase